MKKFGITKLTAVLLIVVIALAVVAGASWLRLPAVGPAVTETVTGTVTATVTPTVTPTVKPVKLTIAAWNVAGKAVEDAVAEYEKANPHVDIEVIPLGRFEILDKITTDFTAHTGSYDIVTYVNNWRGTLASSLADLGQTIPLIDPTFDKDEFIPLLWNEFAVWKDKVVGLPFIIDTRIFFYRTDLFGDINNQREFKEQYGYDLTVPTTQKQLLDIAKFFTSAHGSKYGFLTHMDTSSLDIEFIENFAPARRTPESVAQFGPVQSGWGEAFTSDLKPAFDSDIGVETVEWMKEISKTMPQPPSTLTFDESLALFRDGEAAMLGHWLVAVASLSKENESKVWDKFGTAEMPGLTPIIGGWGMGVNADSKSPEEATKFILYITSKSSQVTSYEKYALGPSRYAAFTALELTQKYPHIGVMKQSFADGSMRPSVEGCEELLDHVDVTVAKILYEGLDVELGLKQLSDEWVEILGR